MLALFDNKIAVKILSQLKKHAKLSSKQNYITKNLDIEIFFGKPVV